MGYTILRHREGGSLSEYKRALIKAKDAIDELCEISEEMEKQFSERSGYGERYGERGRYSRRDDDMWERRP